jgi:hypothetical protein
VRAKGVQGHDLGPHLALHPEDLYARSPFHEPTTERVLRLEADDNDRVAFVLNHRFEVVYRAPAFEHPARGHNDARPV